MNEFCGVLKDLEKDCVLVQRTALNYEDQKIHVHDPSSG